MENQCLLVYYKKATFKTACGIKQEVVVAPIGPNSCIVHPALNSIYIEAVKIFL